MKKSLTLAAILLSHLFTLAYAADFGTKATPMVYFKIPFTAASSKAHKPSYGFAVTPVAEAASGAMELFPQRPALLDLQFQQDEFAGLHINGMPALGKPSQMDADNKESSDSDSIWPLAIIGIVAGGYAIYKATENDGNSPNNEGEVIIIGAGGGGVPEPM